MDSTSTLEKPARWDLPFSLDLPDEHERRRMSDGNVQHLLGLSPFDQMDPHKFPDHLNLEGILRNDCRETDGSVRSTAIYARVR